MKTLKQIGEAVIGIIIVIAIAAIICLPVYYLCSFGAKFAF